MTSTQPGGASEFPVTGGTGMEGLYALAQGGGATWKPEELPEIVRHLLDSPTGLDVPWEATMDEGKALGVGDHQESPTYRELFLSEHPDSEQLMRIKQFARAHWSHPQSFLPAPAAALLYYLSIGAARAAGYSGTSRLSGEALDRGLRWLEEEPWLEASMRSSIEKLRARVKARSSG